MGWAFKLIVIFSHYIQRMFLNRIQQSHAKRGLKVAAAFHLCPFPPVAIFSLVYPQNLILYIM